MQWTTLLDLPRPPAPPARRWWDWAIVAVVVVVLSVEGFSRLDIQWPLGVVGVSLCASLTLLFRRSHPLLSLALAFALLNGLSVVVWTMGLPVPSLGGHVFVLILVFAVFRWGSGRECVATVPLLGVAYASAVVTGETSGFEDVVGGAIALSMPMVLGWGFRVSAQAQRQEVFQARLLEREHLAREMHDTVAHQMAAVAIQAQAAKAVLDVNPTAARAAIDAIETSAKDALTELRDLVGALRDPSDDDTRDPNDREDTSRTPQAGLDELVAMQHAANEYGQIDVVVEVSGDVHALNARLDAALYRIGQESITNAKRHAKNATRVTVDVVGTEDFIRMSITDDGTSPAAKTPQGFGLIGMKERAHLLGGTLAAGPRAAGGWGVEVTLPRGHV